MVWQGHCTLCFNGRGCRFEGSHEHLMHPCVMLRLRIDHPIVQFQLLAIPAHPLLVERLVPIPLFLLPFLLQTSRSDHCCRAPDEPSYRPVAGTKCMAQWRSWRCCISPRGRLQQRHADPSPQLCPSALRRVGQAQRPVRLLLSLTFWLSSSLVHRVVQRCPPLSLQQPQQTPLLLVLQKLLQPSLYITTQLDRIAKGKGSI